MSFSVFWPCFTQIGPKCFLDFVEIQSQLLAVAVPAFAFSSTSVLQPDGCLAHLPADTAPVGAWATHRAGMRFVKQAQFHHIVVKFSS